MGEGINNIVPTTLPMFKSGKAESITLTGIHGKSDEIFVSML